MKTKDEVIGELKDQCKFWRSMWSQSVEMNEALEKRVNESIKQLREIKEHIDRVGG